MLEVTSFNMYYCIITSMLMKELYNKNLPCFIKAYNYTNKLIKNDICSNIN